MKEGGLYIFPRSRGPFDRIAVSSLVLSTSELSINWLDKPYEYETVVK